MKTIKLKTKTMKTIKNLKFLVLPVLFLALFASCSNDDDPEIVNEEEVITRMIVTLSPQGGGTDIILQIEDTDGKDGPAPAVITPMNAVFTANTTYNGSIVLWNDTETPAENKTEEIEEEDDEHQFFYTLNGNVGSTTYVDFDADGNPLGLEFTFTTGAIATGTMTVTLIHEPNKDAMGVSDGDIANATGETDIEATFNISVQ